MQNKLIQFINEHPALKITEIAKEMGVSVQAINPMLNGSGQKKITVNAMFEIAKVLTRYGLKIDDWIFEENENKSEPMLFAYRFSDKEQEVTEHEGGFIYKKELYRQMFDPFDFWEFIHNK